MILLFLFIPFLFGACSLIHQELPNETPVLETSEIDTLRVRRGGQVTLQVRASDEDDDPLFYTWNSFGAGSFRDSAEAATSWIAPQKIQGTSERFVLQVIIRDRQCGLIAEDADRQSCEEEAFQIVETFVVEVIQHPPTLEVTADTTISFSEPFVVIEAVAEDADGDELSYRWEQLSGEELELSLKDFTRSDLTFVPVLPDDYLFGLEVSDGSDTIRTQVAVHVFIEHILPAGGMVRLTLPSSGREYEIDVYEFPGRKGEFPRMVDSWFEAARLCAEEGKRLCSPAEWKNACQGEEGRIYSSVDSLVSPGDYASTFRFCNTSGGVLTVSGSFPNCTSSAGVFDLTGNAREWLQNINAFVQRVGGKAPSDAATLVPCDSLITLEALPPDDSFDFSNPEDINALDPLLYNDYIEFDMGFRCCR